MTVLSNGNAACIRTYLKCSCFGTRVPSKSPAQKRGEEICFGPAKTKIEELWVTIGEEQNTHKAVSYFAVPEVMTCYQSDEAIDHMTNGKPLFRFYNDSLIRHHDGPYNRWTATCWITKNDSSIQYYDM